MSGKIIKIINARVITPDGIIPHGTVIIKDGSIAEIRETNPEISDATEIDAAGRYLSPGFIDIHVHGGGGYDFMDGTEEAFHEIARFHAKHGTTALTPTTLSSDKKSILDTLTLYEKASLNNHDGAGFIGMHLEGPYFAMNQRGAQDPRFIRNPDPEEYMEILAASNAIARWSIAPELEGSIQMGRYLKKKGILPAIAHTDAIYEEVQEAFDSGFTLITHLYSGMSGVTRKNCFRFAGVIESAFIIDDMDVEVIGDGIHVPPPLLKLVYKIKGADKISLITDAIRGAGLPPGESVIGNKDNGLKVILEDGVAKLPDRSSFAGSTATADRLVRTMVTMAGIPLADAVKMLTSTPARIAGFSDKKGTIEPGKDADLILFDEHINVTFTMVKGKLIYEKKFPTGYH